MAEHDPRTYTLIELVGTSPTSYADATKNAVERAGETLRGLGWFEVTELRGLLDNGHRLLGARGGQRPPPGVGVLAHHRAPRRTLPGTATTSAW
jgi:flavin-binding protein dodecin